MGGLEVEVPGRDAEQQARGGHNPHREVQWHDKPRQHALQ